jgi:YegS/Rv2252/BmrU family lipid kinase
MADTLFICNPRAGKQSIKGKLTDVISVLCHAGQPVQVYCTQGPGDATRIVRDRARKFRQIVCSGGDGTLNEVVTGLLQSNAECFLGYLPCGSTNDFSVNLKLPRDLVQAAELTVTGRPFACDVGRFNDRYFVYCAAFGLFTRTSYSVAQEFKNVLGHVAYVLDGIKQLADVPDYHMTVHHDDKTVTGDFIYGMITNSVSVGGFHNLGGRDVMLDDGKFELCLVRRPKTMEQLNEVLTGLIQTDFTDKSVFYTAKVSSVRLECTEPVAWSLDGEFGGETEAAEITVLPQRVMIHSGL